MCLGFKWSLLPLPLGHSGVGHLRPEPSCLASDKLDCGKKPWRKNIKYTKSPTGVLHEYHFPSHQHHHHHQQQRLWRQLQLLQAPDGATWKKAGSGITPWAPINISWEASTTPKNEKVWKKSGELCWLGIHWRGSLNIVFTAHTVRRMEKWTNANSDE